MKDGPQPNKKKSQGTPAMTDFDSPSRDPDMMMVNSPSQENNFDKTFEQDFQLSFSKSLT